MDEHMARAVALANADQTQTSPNPWVGSVVVTPDGATFEGATEPPGGPHAESSRSSRQWRGVGSTLYVTLEPCAHQGRTPPCTDAIVEAGVARVLVALEDPDPLVSGRGIQTLRDAGIQVDVGEGAAEVTACSLLT